MTGTPADGSISVLILRALLAGAAASGIEPARLAEDAGLPAGAFDPAVLADPDARVPGHVALRLWETLPKLSQRETFGLWLSDLVGAAPLTAAAWFILSSPTLGEGLERAVRFQRLLHDQAASELTQSEQGITYLHRIGDAAFRAPRHAIEFGFAQIVHLMRRASGRPLTPAWAEFQHAPPPERSHHQRLFGAEVRFNASSDRIHFDRVTCELPSLQADPALGELVAAHARALLARLPEDSSIAGRVRRALAAELPGRLLTVEVVATSLSLSKRTLQRRLRDEGTSFDEIVDELRRHLSERYLAEHQFSVQETAFLLGFSDVSAFHRAFSRWTGRSPARFRLDS
ncbi:MAG TPA: AraC family transcriptional regulator [Polyangiaceae bacterium]|jgi:AraC-like DNA-binding protein|nr:AraC family transcriptional regulator [Polyangiaceae bacterium]